MQIDYRYWYEKYKSYFFYLLFGVLTTIVNVVVYWVMAHPLQCGVLTSTIVAWVLAVLFAYITNRKWVFNSTSEGIKEIGREIISFFLCRVATGVLDLFCMWLFVDVLHWNDIVIKFLSNVVVVILNYVASKVLIFKSK